MKKKIVLVLAGLFLGAGSAMACVGERPVETIDSQREAVGSGWHAERVGGQLPKGYWGRVDRAVALEDTVEALRERLQLEPSQLQAWWRFVDSRPDPRKFSATPEELCGMGAVERTKLMGSYQKVAKKAMGEHTRAIKALYAKLYEDQRNVFDTVYSKGPFWSAPDR